MKVLNLINNLKLKNKLVIFMLIGILLPLLTIGFIINKSATNSLKDRAFEQLNSVSKLKKINVEDYFKTIENQIITFSENSMVTSAMSDFDNTFSRLGNNFNIDELDPGKQKLKNYYTTQYKVEYEKQNNNTVDINTLIPTKPSALIAQYFYIANNPNALGEKHKLIKPDLKNDSFYGYNHMHKRYHSVFVSFLEKFGYYDIFLINPKGDIVYSVYKELDYATNLINGPYSNTNFAETFKAAANSPDKNSAHIVDFKPYVPSYNSPASFISSPIFNNENKLLGVIVFQMPVAKINDIVNESSGMGKTGQTYLVGSDYLMRSQSRFTEDSTILSLKVNTEAVSTGLSGKDGHTLMPNYKGTNVLANFSPLDIKDLSWVIVSEIEEAEALSSVYELRKIIAICSFVAIVLVILLALYLARNVNQQLGGDPSKIVSRADTIASGDLTLSTDSDVKVLSGAYASMMAMQEKLKEVIGSTVNIASVVSSTAQEIAQGNLNLSDRTEQQASSLEETAASMEEMTSTVKQNADNAKQANQLARAARDQAEKGGAVVGDAVTAMNDINESSKKIADIIGVIDEIAFQTNLLALNAAVEAARAGEQGRGFAVVASEVRNLAGRSATAAKEIKDLIQDSVTKIDSGAELVNQSGQTLEEIVTSVKKVSDIIAEIAAASQEQSAGIDEVGKAIMQMDDLTQQNAALVEQAAASSETMGTKAKSLSEMLTFFKVDDNVVVTESKTKVQDTKPADIVADDKPKTSNINASANYKPPANNVAVADGFDDEDIPKAHPGQLMQKSNAMQTSNSEWEEF